MIDTKALIGAAVLSTVMCVCHAQPARAQSTVVESIEAACPSLLGVGRLTGLMFCDVLTGRDLAEGIEIELPARRGDMVLTFDLHNRHTYSDDLVREGRAFRRYTATVGVLTDNNDLLARAVIQNEFRTAADLEDRVGGGAGPGGVKAVAPTGVEHIRVTIPPGVERVSILGEKLTVISADSTDNFTALGRPIAIVSNLAVEFTPR
jgi:hypothetical protein